jgi:hypothetical protein
MSQPTPTETLREASARLQQQYLAYHATFGTCDTGDVLAIATERLAKKYRACYAAFVSRHLPLLERTLSRERGIEAFFEVPTVLHRLMPASLVPIGRLTQDPLAKELSRLCLKAFNHLLLSRRWLNGRHFIDSDYRYHVEYVCGFEDLAQVAREVAGDDRVVDLQVVALGLQELLECLDPDALHRKNACRIKVATAMCERLLRQVKRFIAKVEALPKHTMLEDFPMTEAELRAF